MHSRPPADSSRRMQPRRGAPDHVATTCRADLGHRTVRTPRASRSGEHLPPILMNKASQILSMRCLCLEPKRLTRQYRGATGLPCEDAQPVPASAKARSRGSLSRGFDLRPFNHPQRPVRTVDGQDDVAFERRAERPMGLWAEAGESVLHRRVARPGLAVSRLDVGAELLCALGRTG